MEEERTGVYHCLEGRADSGQRPFRPNLRKVQQMQEVHAGGNQRPQSATTYRDDRVFQDPDGVKYRFKVPKLPSPIGWTGEVSYKKQEPIPFEGGVFDWLRVDIEKMHVSEPAHLMLIEGAAPAWLFMGARLEEVEVQTTDAIHGPFLLLAASYPSIHTVPYFIKDIVLALPLSVPTGMKLTDVLPQLISIALNNPS